MTLPNTFGTIATGAQEPGQNLDQNFQALGSSVVVQCTATGTNAIALTEVTNAYQPTAYANYQLFSFVAPNNSTASVTLQYRALAALPWYRAGATPSAETQNGNGDIIANTYYIVAYNSALNGGTGGFVTVSVTASQTSSVARCGCNMASGGTFNNSFGLSGASKPGTGQYTINISPAFSSANWSPVFTPISATALTYVITAQSTSAISVTFQTVSGAAATDTNFAFLGFGS